MDVLWEDKEEIKTKEMIILMNLKTICKKGTDSLINQDKIEIVLPIIMIIVINKGWINLEIWAQIIVINNNKIIIIVMQEEFQIITIAQIEFKFY